MKGDFAALFNSRDNYFNTGSLPNKYFWYLKKVNSALPELAKLAHVTHTQPTECLYSTLLNLEVFSFKPTPKDCFIKPTSRYS